MVFEIELDGTQSRAAHCRNWNQSMSDSSSIVCGILLYEYSVGTNRGVGSKELHDCSKCEPDVQKIPHGPRERVTHPGRPLLCLCRHFSPFPSFFPPHLHSLTKHSVILVMTDQIVMIHYMICNNL